MTYYFYKFAFLPSGWPANSVGIVTPSWSVLVLSCFIFVLKDPPLFSVLTCPIGSLCSAVLPFWILRLSITVFIDPLLINSCSVFCAFLFLFCSWNAQFLSCILPCSILFCILSCSPAVLFPACLIPFCILSCSIPVRYPSLYLFLCLFLFYMIFFCSTPVLCLVLLCSCPVSCLFYSLTYPPLLFPCSVPDLYPSCLLLFGILTFSVSCLFYSLLYHHRLFYPALYCSFSVASPVLFPFVSSPPLFPSCI